MNAQKGRKCQKVQVGMLAEGEKVSKGSGGNVGRKDKLFHRDSA